MRLTGIAIVVVLLAATGPVEATGKDSPTPTFSKEVAPVLFQNCVTCHRPGEVAPFSLLSYKDAQKRGKLIAKLTETRQMPPWKAEKGDIAFRGERRLKDDEIALIKRWVEGGMPEGNPADLPKTPEFADSWPLGKPDLVVKMPKAYKVPAEGRDIYRNFAIPLGLKEDKWVKAIDFRPSARSVVHHTLFFLDPTGTAYKKEEASGEVGQRGAMGGVRGGAGGLSGILSGLGGEGGSKRAGGGGLGGWAVGAQARSLPDGLAYHLPKGADLILSTHFHLSGKVEEEASTVAFYFVDEEPKQRFTGVQLPFGFGVGAGINIPAGKKDFTIEDSFVLPVDVKAFGITAHAHYLAKNFKVTATLPEGKMLTVLSVPDWDFAWQEQYRFDDMVPLPKGTKLHARIVYDNSADNPNNPTSPPRTVRWGPQSTDEMGSITLEVVAAREDEFAQLQKGYFAHILNSAGKGFLKKKMK